MDYSKIQDKWQKKWKVAGLDKAEEKGKKYYVLEMYPYPSGSASHIGHARNYVIGDTFARFKRMQGFSVLHPIGWDSFGLPTENAAIAEGIHPYKSIEKSIKTMKDQFRMLSLSYDWGREIDTSTPEYYKWTQWIFLKMLEQGLAYKKKATGNWCPGCETTLANEDVKEGKCWRCDSEVLQKEIDQWFFKITDYADRLLEDIDKLEWSEKLKSMQRNWIGKSKGTNLIFKVKDSNKEFKTFTTRPDTYFGITFMAMAPEHPLMDELIKGAKNEKELRAFVEKVRNMPELDRMTKDKKGMFTGKYAINPVTGEEIELWIANYVVASYGTGVVIAVPTHDQRDFEFAKEYDIPMKVVITPEDKQLQVGNMKRAFTTEGIMVNSDKFDGMKNTEAKDKITDFLIKKGYAERETNYKIRDWNVSRQRYWGAPIPIIYCDKCGAVPVPEKDLPVQLPLDVKFGKKGATPLSTNENFVNAKCPKCGGQGKRETDTMTTFVDSSWYYLRYCSPNSKQIFDKDKVKFWMPVDQYIGGLEHAVGHLMYARFVTKLLKDMGYIDFDEPFIRLLNQGYILKDGVKMSKSKGNTVDPRPVIKENGVDVVRTYILAMAHPTKDIEWSDSELAGVKKFMDKVVLLADDITGKKNKYMDSIAQRKIEKITDYTERLELNSVIIELMDFATKLVRYPSEYAYKIFLKMLTPYAPHVCEELWEKLGNKELISIQKWPKVDKKKIDLESEASEELLSQVKSDIREVSKLVGKEPEKVTIFVSDEWKYKFITILKKEMKAENRDFKKILGKIPANMKVHMKDITKLIPRLLKDESKIPNVILSESKEYKMLSGMKDDLKAKFNAKIEVVKASSSKEAKAKQAFPMKPGILFS